MATWIEIQGELINTDKYEKIKLGRDNYGGYVLKLMLFKDAGITYATKTYSFKDDHEAREFYIKIKSKLAHDYVGLHKFLE